MSHRKLPNIKPRPRNDLPWFVGSYYGGASCPAITNLAEYYHTSTEVMLEWDANGESLFDVYYGPTPLVAPDENTVPTVTSVTNSKLITGLTAATGYAFYVRSSCGGAWSDPVTVTTAFTELRFTIDTRNLSTGSTTNTQFRPTLRAGQAYNCVIDWGDASTTNQVNSTSPTHVYAAPGIYDIKISGTFYGFSFNNGQDRLKMISITNWGDIIFGATQTSAYRGCANLNITATDRPNLSNVVTFTSYFTNCLALNSTNLNTWNVSSIQTFQTMLSGCTSFNSPLNRWDISNANIFSSMLFGCTSFNSSVAGWVFPGGSITLNGMFSGCTSFNHSSISTWDFSSVIDLDLGSLFNTCSAFNQSLNSWNISSCTNLASTFSGCTNFNGDITNWNTGMVLTVSQLFSGCTNFNQDISGWNVEAITTFTNCFRNCTSFNQDLSSWNTISGSGFAGMFYGCTSFNSPIFQTTLGGVNMSEMFSGCTIFNQDVTNLVTSAATNISQILKNCTAFNHASINTWDTSNVVNSMNSTFNGCTNFNQSLSNWNVGKVTDFTYCFLNCTSFNGDVTTWRPGTGGGTQIMTGMFQGCSVFNQNINSWVPTNCISTSSMFDLCVAYNQPMNNWDMSNNGALDAMFNSASSFNQNIGNWNITSASYISFMFNDATAFNQDISGWEPFNVQDGTNFMGLKTDANYDASKLDAIYTVWGSKYASFNFNSWNLDFGTIKYTASGQAGKDLLTGLVSLIITDGGI